MDSGIKLLNLINFMALLWHPCKSSLRSQRYGERTVGSKRLYLVGVIDSYSRICWVMPIISVKALDVSYATMEMLVILRNRYGIEFKEMMSDNGVEFSSRGNIDGHPFEKMLNFLQIKHVYTKPCSPKSNGKIERFWRTLEDELLSGESFDTLEEFTHYIKGYCLYYNEHRMHQGIDLKKACRYGT